MVRCNLGDVLRGSHNLYLSERGKDFFSKRIVFIAIYCSVYSRSRLIRDKGIPRIIDAF